MFKLPKLQNVWLRLFLVSPYKGRVAAGTPFFKSYFIIYNKLAGKEEMYDVNKGERNSVITGGGVTDNLEGRQSMINAIMDC